MKDDLMKPPKESIIYDDERLYVCLASYPITSGHIVVVWKDNVPDLSKLSEPDYEYLMDNVNKVRSAMMAELGVKKIYLLYMDEVKHVHWHLIPRYNEEGYDIFTHKPQKLKDYKLANRFAVRLGR